jgi:hypothetical protein
MSSSSKKKVRKSSLGWAARDADGNPLDGAKNPWPHLRRL